MPPEETMTAEEAAIANGTVPQPVETVASQPEPQPAPQPEIIPEPTPVATPAPAAAPAAQPAPAAGQPAPATAEPRTVPLALFLEQKNQHRQDMAKLQGRLDQLSQILAPQQQPQAPQAPALPDVDADPVANLKAINEYVRGQQKRDQDAAAAQQTDGEQRDRMREFGNAVLADESQFMVTAPDYLEAVAHLKGAVADELRMQGVPEVDIRPEVERQARVLADTALRAGRSPAQVAYNMAKSRGYQQRAAVPAAAPAAQPVPASTQQAAQPTAVQQLAAVQAGVDRGAKSLANGAAAPGLKMDLSTLVKMSDEEFGAMVTDAEWNRIMRAAY